MGKSQFILSDRRQAYNLNVVAYDGIDPSPEVMPGGPNEEAKLRDMP
jgi:hypothetical protein